MTLNIPSHNLTTCDGVTRIRTGRFAGREVLVLERARAIVRVLL